MDFKTLSEISSALPVLVPQLHKKLSNTAFKVASVYVPLDRPLQYEELTRMHISALSDQFSVIPETLEFVREDNEGRNVITSIVEANLISKEYDKKATSGMRVLSANVFIDGDYQLWKVVGHGDKRRIVQSLKEDFGAIMASRINSRRNELIASVAYNGMPQTDARGGDFVLFYNTDSSELDSGFAFTASDHGDAYRVFSFNNKEFVLTNPHTIVRAADSSTFARGKTLADEIPGDYDLTDGEMKGPLVNRYRDYMATLYSGTDYFARLTDLLSLRSRSAADNLPVSTMKV